MGYDVDWLPLLMARPAADKTSGRLVSASRRTCGLAARTYRFHQLKSAPRRVR